MSLAEGHNIAYITVWYNETEDLNIVYYLDIYRLGMRTYQFLVDGVTYQEERTVEEQTMITAPAGTPRKLGYTFRGWKAMEEGAEPPYSEQTFPYRLDVTTVFEASFKANTYAVTYDALGGTVLAYAPKSALTMPCLPFPSPQKRAIPSSAGRTKKTINTFTLLLPRNSCGNIRLLCSLPPCTRRKNTQSSII